MPAEQLDFVPVSSTAALCNIPNCFDDVVDSLSPQSQHECVLSSLDSLGTDHHLLLEA